MRNLLLFGYCIYLYFAYHLLIIPAFAEFSFYAFLSLPLILSMFWLIPNERRKKMIVYTFLFLFFDQAIFNISHRIGPIPYILVAFIGLFLFPLVRWYARISFLSLLISLLVALSFNMLLPDRTVLALPHLYPKWSSDKNYIGHVTNSFPVITADIDQDGKDAIITLGNKDFYPKGIREAKFSYMLENEPLHIIVWKSQDGKLTRIPNDQLDQDSIRRHLSKDFIAYPYYILNEELILEPLVQRQALTESMIQFGHSPFIAMRLNLNYIQKLLEINESIYDAYEELGLYTDLELKDGKVSGLYRGSPFETNTDASRIIGIISLQEGEEGLLLQGLNVELLQMNNDLLEVTHTLTREMQRDLALGQFLTYDVTNNGIEEFIVTFPASIVLEPAMDGSWKILWSASERSFNIKDIGSFSADGPTEILALRKSAVRASDVNYLTSYNYTDKGLVQNWKVFIRNFDTVTFADLNGDGKNELVTTIYGKQKVYVWGKHSIPVTPTLSLISVLLIMYLAGRRYANVKKKKGV